MGVTKGLVQEFGRDRVLDTPITEAGFIGAAVGAAATGLRPVAELMFVDFFGCCMDQIFDQGAKLRYMFGGKAKCPLVIRTQIGAGVSAAGQHSGCHYSVFTHMPGIKCVVPSTPADAKGLLLSAIRDDDLVMFFENKVLYGTKGEVPEGNEGIPLGQADVKRAGDDVTVVAISRMVQQALAAADTLAGEGIEVEVIDPRTLSPLDDETILASVAKTHRLVDRRRGQPALQRGRRYRGPGGRQGLRHARRAHQARHRAAHAGAVQPAIGGGSTFPARSGSPTRCAKSSEVNRAPSRLSAPSRRELMPTIVTMPKWGLTMTSGTVTGWSRQEGDPVTRGRAAPDRRNREGRRRRRGAGQRHAAQDRRGDGSEVPVTRSRRRHRGA